MIPFFGRMSVVFLGVIALAAGLPWVGWHLLQELTTLPLSVTFVMPMAVGVGLVAGIGYYLLPYFIGGRVYRWLTRDLA